VELAFVDQGYTGAAPAEAARTNGIALHVVRTRKAKRGFVLLPRRLGGLLTAVPAGSGSSACWPMMGGRAQLRLGRLVLWRSMKAGAVAPFYFVMVGLEPTIQKSTEDWMAGSSPSMTI
jgi:hypothetical protein